MRLTRRRSSGGPVASYAGILDGRRLWLSLAGDAGSSVALRDDSGAVHPLTGDLTAGVELPGEVGAWDVVRDGEPVSVGPLPQGPTRVPPSPDGLTQLALVRTEAGTLRVRRNRRSPGVDVLDLAPEGDGVRVTLAADATELRVGDASFPVEDRTAVLAPGPTGPVTAQPGDLPLRRRANGLATPGQAVLLPEPLRWSPAGELVAR